MYPQIQVLPRLYPYPAARFAGWPRIPFARFVSCPTPCRQATTSHALPCLSRLLTRFPDCPTFSRRTNRGCSPYGWYHPIPGHGQTGSRWYYKSLPRNFSAIVPSPKEHPSRTPRRYHLPGDRYSTGSSLPGLRLWPDCLSSRWSSHPNYPVPAMNDNSTFHGRMKPRFAKAPRSCGQAFYCPPSRQSHPGHSPNVRSPYIAVASGSPSRTIPYSAPPSRNPCQTKFRRSDRSSSWSLPPASY